MSVLSPTYYTLWSGTTVGVGATLTSAAIDLSHVDFIEALLLKVSSAAGTANVRAEFQTSHTGLTTDWDEEDDNPDITSSTLIDRPGNLEGWNRYPMPAVNNRYVRVLIDEISAAALTDTLVFAKIVAREGLS